MVYNQFVDFAINQSYRLGQIYRTIACCFSIMPQDDKQNEDTLTANLVFLDIPEGNLYSMKVQLAEKIIV